MNKSLSFDGKFDIVLTCASGLEKVVKSELKRLLNVEAPAINGGVTFSGSASDVAKCNVNLRAVDRVYIKISQFPVETFDEIFERVKDVPWENIFPPNAKIIVNGKCVKSKIFAVSATQSIIKKAIVVRLLEKYRISSLNETGALYEVDFDIFKDECTLKLNTSGVGLHKRGYRDLVGIAPIKETLASGLVLLSDYYYKNPFIDPFCGSGTIAIETAKIALNIGGGVLRKFAFNDWDNFDKNYYKRAIEEARDNEKRDIKPEIIGYDIDKKAIELSKYHAKKAGLERIVKFCVGDVKDLKSNLSNGTIVTNPPYGERVYDIREAEACYKNLGHAYKRLDNWSLFAITSAPSFEKHFGIKADRSRKLYNSNRECRFYYYYKNKGENK